MPEQEAAAFLDASMRPRLNAGDDRLAVHAAARLPVMLQ